MGQAHTNTDHATDWQGFRLAVIVPAFNSASTISETISSVLAQPRFDDLTIDQPIIVCDDGSTDETAAIARQRGAHVRVLSGANRGACHARNRGAAAAIDTGATHLFFLDADDQVAGDYFVAAAEAATSGADLLLGQIERRRHGQTVHVRAVEDADLTPETAFARWLSEPQINPSGLFFRSDFFRSIGGWNEDVLINQDGEIALRAFLHRPRIARVDRGHGVYFQGRVSLSSQHSEAKLSNYIETLSGLVSLADQRGFGQYTRSLEDTIYGVSRMAFRNGWTDTGRQGLAVLKSRGVQRHVGSLGHRLASTLLGLEHKVRLWKR